MEMQLENGFKFKSYEELRKHWEDEYNALPWYWKLLDNLDTFWRRHIWRNYCHIRYNFKPYFVRLAHALIGKEWKNMHYYCWSFDMNIIREIHDGITWMRKNDHMGFEYHEDNKKLIDELIKLTELYSDDGKLFWLSDEGGPYYKRYDAPTEKEKMKLMKEMGKECEKMHKRMHKLIEEVLPHMWI